MTFRWIKKILCRHKSRYDMYFCAKDGFYRLCGNCLKAIPVYKTEAKIDKMWFNEAEKINSYLTEEQPK